MPNTDIIPLGSSCPLCSRSNGERHAETCPVGSRVGRVRGRVAAALAAPTAASQARYVMTILEDAAADCENDLDAMHVMMTLAEAREVYAHAQSDEATSIALDGLETLLGESFAGGGAAVDAPVALSSATLSAAVIALELRHDSAEAELAACSHARHYFAPHGGTETIPVGEAREQLEAELAILGDALTEIRNALAV